MQFLIFSNCSFLFFLFSGKNPKKVNSVVSRPEQINAFTNAQAPGIGTILISFSIHCLTISSPGSEMPGVPASVINAIFLLSFNFSISNSDFTSSLCL